MRVEAGGVSGAKIANASVVRCVGCKAPVGWRTWPGRAGYLGDLPPRVRETFHACDLVTSSLDP